MATNPPPARDKVLERGKRIERSHNIAKHKPRWRRADRDKTKKIDDEQAAWRKDYKRNARPELDDQSWYSKILESVGLDEPYREDAGSYDYRSRKAKENPDNPAYWFPEIPDQVTDAIEDTAAGIAGGDQVDRVGEDQYETVAAQYKKETGKTLSRKAWADAIADEWYNQFINDNNRAPTEEEYEAGTRGMYDPRTRDEKNRAAILSFLDIALLGAGDEAVAGFGSAFGQQDYDSALADARQTMQDNEKYEDPWSARNIAAMAAGIPTAFMAPLGVLGAGGKLVAKAAPQFAATTLGKATAAVAGGAPAGAGFMAGMDFAAGEGGFDKRMENVDPILAAAGAIGGGILGPILGAGVNKVKGKAVSAGQKVIQDMQRMRKTASSAPKPWRPMRDNSLRNEITKNLARSAQHNNPSKGGAVPLAVGALGGAGTAAYMADQERRKRR